MKILETQYGEDFVGRDFEVQDLKSKIRNNGVVVLTGNRGIGKTNLMRVLEDFFKQDRECHYIESGSLFSMEMSRYFLPEKVETGVSHSASAMGFGGGAGRSWSPREESILEGMEKSNEMIIFVENAHELRKEDMGIIFAGTGRNNKLKFVLEIAKPYDSYADLKITSEQFVELGKLGESDIVKIVENECLDFTEEVVKRIVSLSDGYPYIARSLAYICEKKESKTEMFEFLNTLQDKDMEHTLNRIHKGVLATLDKEAQALIKRLAIAPPVLTLHLIEAFCGDDADTSLGEVIERGILKDLESVYVIYHPLFRDYLQKSQRISLKNKRKIYSEAMEKVKSEFDSLYLLLEVLTKIDFFNELVEIAENYDALNSIGDQSYIWGKISEATLAWSRILKVATSAKDNNWISVATGNIGIIYRIQGNMGKALEHHQKALKIDEEIGNKQGIASQLGNMGIVYRVQGDFGKALEYYEKALEIGEEIGDKQGMASQLGNMGIVYQIQGDMGKALEYHQKALEIEDEIGNKEGLANQLGNMGTVYRIQGDMGKALEHHQKALEIDEEIGNREGIANDLGNMGTVYQVQMDVKKASEHHQKALEIEEEIGNKEGIASQLGNMGNVYRVQRNMGKALEYYEKALEIHEEIGNKQGIANDLGNMGTVYQIQGDMGKALEYYEKALEIDEEIGDKQGMASQLGNMGTVYQIQRDMGKALEHYEKALIIFKDIGDKPNEANTLMNIGIVFINKGEKSTALDYLLVAQDIAIDYASHIFDKISEVVNELLETQ